MQDSKTNQLINTINSYRPGIFDFFGYDISGRRKQLIMDIIKACNGMRDKEIAPYLGNLKKNLDKTRIDQDISLGIFLNAIQDRDLDLNKIDKSLKSLLIAGERPYHDLKLNLELGKEEQKLLNNIFEKMKDSSSVKLAIEEVINNWLMSNHENLERLQHNSKASYKQQVYKMFVNMVGIIDNKGRQGYKGLPKVFSLNKELTWQLQGKLIENICSRVAQNNTEHDPENFIKERSKIIELLPENLKKIHTEYAKQSIIQINSLRVMQVFQKNMTLEKLSSSLIEIFQDDSLYDTFKKHIDKVTTKEGDKLKWRMPFTNELLASADFQEFIKEALNSADLEKKQYQKLFKKVSTPDFKSKQKSSFQESLENSLASERGRKFFK